MKKQTSVFNLLTSILFIAIMTGLLPSCKKDGRVVFQNRSVTNKTYNVVWDGSVIASLYPFSNSDTFDVEPGPHTLEFKFANSGLNACSPSDPVINDGDIHTFWCSQ
ncbi:MAG: hypothetical protein ABMA02_18600 [Saprospiraceae bacterium]